MDVEMKVLQGKPRGHCLRFGHGEFVFGRGEECHVRPNSEWVSRQHCILRVSGESVSIRDLGSTNGTLINGRLLTGECALADGDTLQVGPLVLQVSLSHLPTLSDQLGNTLSETEVFDKQPTVAGVSLTKELNTPKT